MSHQQELFDHFYVQHQLTLTMGEINDIIELVKKEIGHQKKVEDAFDEGVEDEYNVHINSAKRTYLNGRDYFNKTFKEQ